MGFDPGVFGRFDLAALVQPQLKKQQGIERHVLPNACAAAAPKAAEALQEPGVSSRISERSSRSNGIKAAAAAVAAAAAAAAGAQRQQEQRLQSSLHAAATVAG